MNQDKLNALINDKVKVSIQTLKAEQKKLGIKHGNEGISLEQSLNSRTSKTAGVISRIRYRFKKSGVFVHKGVGRGTKASQVGSTNRKPKEWFNPIIEQVADEIVEAVADHYADECFEVIINKLKIK